MIKEENFRHVEKELHINENIDKLKIRNKLTQTPKNIFRRLSKRINIKFCRICIESFSDSIIETGSVERLIGVVSAILGRIEEFGACETRFDLFFFIGIKDNLKYGFAITIPK